MRTLAIIITVLLFTQISEARSFDKIRIKGQFIVVDDFVDEATIQLRNEYGAVCNIPFKSDGSFTFDAYQDQKYVVSFIKDGCIQKDVIIDTHFEGEITLRNVRFNVKLYPQSSDITALIYNQPVGEITFSDGTNFDVVYNYNATLVSTKMNF